MLSDSFSLTATFARQLGCELRLTSLGRHLCGMRAGWDDLSFSTKHMVDIALLSEKDSSLRGSLDLRES